MRVYLDADADLALIRAKRVAILGYGNQGRAQALNLHDSGVAVTVALPDGSASRGRAAADGFDVMTAAEAARGADLVVMLAADEDHGRIYAGEVAPNLREGAALSFAHGLSIRFGLVAPRPDLDVFLVAPKGPGTALRRDYLAGSGLISLFAVAQDASGGAEALALSYAAAIGSGRIGILPTSFAEECEADLFNEQAVLWGAIPELIHAGFETLVEAGFAPEIAYFECLTEVKLLADLAERMAPYKRITVTLRGEVGDLAAFGDVVSSTENTATLHVPRTQAGDRTARLVRELGDQLADISVEDPPIEEVIDKVFTSERPLAEATA